MYYFQVGVLACEPAILVRRRGRPPQVWSVERLDLKLLEIRAAEDCDEGEEDAFAEGASDSYELIGVANVFLSCLFSDCGLEYDAPVISRQGETAGRLRVKLQRLKGQLVASNMNESMATSSDASTATSSLDESTVLVRVTVLEASGLPPALSHFVFCQYTLWGEEELTTVPPAMATPVKRNGDLNNGSPDQTDNHFR